jgi:hypothetical protein
MKQTEFEKAVDMWKRGEMQIPSVNYDGKELNYFEYALNIHVAQCRAMSKGLQFKAIKLRDLKNYYGVKGRSAKDLLPKLEQIKTEELWKKQ